MAQRSLRVLIAAGGTGGHIFPAIAIANAVKEREPETRFQFVGALGKMEMEKVPAAGYPIIGLLIRGFQRSAPWRNIGLPWRLLKSMLKARRGVHTFEPDIAIGVDPCGRRAKKFRVPFLTQGIARIGAIDRQRYDMILFVE